MVYVFKTTVQDLNDVQKITPYLDELLVNQKCNFDLEDCDKILRIESQTDIIEFECEELE